MKYMKKGNKHTEDSCDIAIIDSILCKKSCIDVEQKDRGTIPHLHVYLDKTRNPKNCGYIQVDTDEYTHYHVSKKDV